MHRERFDSIGGSVYLQGQGHIWLVRRYREPSGSFPLPARAPSDWATAGDRPGGPGGRTMPDPLYVGRTTREHFLLRR